MNEELNRKLAEWAGFKRISKPFATSIKEQAWEYPDGEWDLERDLPNFTKSLDACFKWLVPKVLEHFALYLYVGSTIDVEIIPLYGNPDVGNVTQQADTPALALCLAIEKMVEDEG